MADAIKILSLKMYPGAQAGLDQQTAMCILGRDADRELTESEVNTLRSLIGELTASDPFYGVSLDDWPAALLVNKNMDYQLSAWIAAITVTLQRLAHDWACKGQVVSRREGRLMLALPWMRKWVLEKAIRLTTTYLPDILAESDGVSKRAFISDCEAWCEKVQPGGLAPNTRRFAHAAIERDIPVGIKLGGVAQFGWGKHAVLMSSSFTSKTGTMATRYARNKIQTKDILGNALLPVPQGVQLQDPKGLDGVVQRFGWPLVVKPNGQDQGKGVVANISSMALLQSAFQEALKDSPEGVIVEKHIQGDDHRMLVVGGKLLMATRRINGGVTGDGRSSVRELVAKENQNPLRGTSSRSLMISLSLDEEALLYLDEQGLNEGSVPESGQFVPLRRTANISTGGTAIDVTASAHPDNVYAAERAARLVGLDIAGVDFLCPDITRSWQEVGGGICEVNAQPGFRPHWLSDPQRDINGEIIDWLIPEGKARIPAIAITGTNGKTTVAQMVHAIMLESGLMSGVCTSQGAWIGRHQISARNQAGYYGGRVLLEEPDVECAVIEIPCESLSKSGHPCDQYDVGVLLNVQDDHIGSDSISTLQEMARQKATVLARTSKTVVVNGDDLLCMRALQVARAPRAIIVSRKNSGELAERLRKGVGQETVFIARQKAAEWIVYNRNGVSTPVIAINDIPATVQGKLGANIANAMFAVAISISQGVKIKAIRAALGSFSSDQSHNPGRFNVIEGFPFNVILDGARNPDAVQALCDFMQQQEVQGKRRLVSFNVGNAYKRHIDHCAKILAGCFDEFVLGGDVSKVNGKGDYAGDNPLGDMQGYFSRSMINAGVKDESLFIAQNVKDGVSLGISRSQPGDLLVVLAECSDALPEIKSHCDLLQQFRAVDVIGVA